MLYKELRIYDRDVLVCSAGTIYIKKHNQTSWSKMTEYVDKRNYHRVLINHRYVRVHRLVAYAFGIAPVLKLPQGLCIDHINDNPEDNRVNNLQLITIQENRKKEHLHQLDQLPYTYCIYKQSNTEKAVAVAPSIGIAAEYLGVDRSFVSQVVNGKRKSCNGHTVRRVPKKQETSKDTYRQMMDAILGAM